MPPPQTPKKMKRVSGMFAYYAKLIDNFSSQAGLLLRAETFPLKGDSTDAFILLKQELANACRGAKREDISLVVDSNAYDYAIAGILSQEGRPVAFMSRTLNACEQRYPTIEKEGTAIIESVRKWTHFLKT